MRISEILSMKQILDLKDLTCKTLKSFSGTYSSSMENSKRILAENVESLIGDGKRFRSAPELAARAHLLGLTEKTENLTRNINRIRASQTDPQLSTLEAIAGAAGVRVSDLVSQGTLPSPEMRELIDLLLEADRTGGINRTLVLNTLKLVLTRPEPATIGQALKTR